MPLRRLEFELSSSVGLGVDVTGGIIPPTGTGTVWNQLAATWDSWALPYGDGLIDPTTGAWWDTQNVTWNTWNLTWGN